MGSIIANSVTVIIAINSKDDFAFHWLNQYSLPSYALFNDLLSL